MNGKKLDEDQRKAMVWDIERGQANDIQPMPWHTDTCIGGWHYDRGIYDRDGYKTAKTVIQSLVDIVSKNGNLMLNIPVRGDGTIDEKEKKVVDIIRFFFSKTILINSIWILRLEYWIEACGRVTHQDSTIPEALAKNYHSLHLRLYKGEKTKMEYRFQLGFWGLTLHTVGMKG